MGHGFLTINNSRMTVLKTMVIMKQPQLNLPYVTVLHQKMTESQLYVHCLSHLRLL